MASSMRQRRRIQAAYDQNHSQSQNQNHSKNQESNQSLESQISEKLKESGSRESEYQGSSFQSETQKKHSVPKTIIAQAVGFNNLGNTCYMNSFLQAFLSSNVLNTLIALYIQQNPKCFDKMCPMMLEYCRLIIELMEPMNGDKKNIMIRPYAPTSFKRTLDSQNPWFRGSQQHDADEFMLYCINEFIDPKKNPDLAGLIKKLCFGKYKQYLRCNECESVSEEFFDFLNVQLPIPSKKQSLTGKSQDTELNLEDCFREFAKYERLDGKNMQKCSKCNKKVVSYKKMVISHTPDVAIFTLIRYKNSNGQRDTTPIRVFKYIQLEKKKLKLIATVNHYGGMGGGHYVANVLRKGEWYHMNDSSARKLNEVEVSKMVIDPSIYMVIYQTDA